MGSGPRIHSMASVSDCHTGENITIFPDLKTARIGHNVGATSWKRKDGASLFDFLTSGPRPSNVIFEDLGFKEIEGLLTHGYRETVLGTQDDGDANGAVKNTTEWWVSDDIAEVVVQIITNARTKVKNESRLANIRRSEPDSALFEIPKGYKIEHLPNEKNASGKPRDIKPEPTEQP